MDVSRESIVIPMIVVEERLPNLLRDSSLKKWDSCPFFSFYSLVEFAAVARPLDTVWLVG